MFSFLKNQKNNTDLYESISDLAKLNILDGNSFYGNFYMVTNKKNIGKLCLMILKSFLNTMMN